MDSLDLEFSRNLTALNKCRKNYTKLLITYAFVFGMYALFVIFLMLGTVIQHDCIFLFIDMILIIPFAAIRAFVSCTARNNPAALTMMITLGLNQFILGLAGKYTNGEYMVFFTFKSVKYCFWVHLAISAIAVIAGFINIRTNNKYHYLEKQEGFPQFNIRFFEQEMDKQQRSFYDPYQHKKDMLEINSDGGEMKEVAVRGEAEKYVKEHHTPDMDSISFSDDSQQQ